MARKTSPTSVFILQLKPRSYIYPSQTYPAQGGGKKDVALVKPLLGLGFPFHLKSKDDPIL